MNALKYTVLTFAALLITATGVAKHHEQQHVSESSGELKTPSAFSQMQGKAYSVAVFKELGKVIQHPRCVNCHGAHDRPLQGDDMRPHEPPVTRGEAGMGKPGMTCTTCHGSDNANVRKSWSMPGHVPWKMAPATQVWEGKTLTEICEQLKDKSRSHMTLEELVTHFAEDGLVGWGWHPGNGRTPAPGTQEIAGKLARAWVDSGAHCPKG